MNYKVSKIYASGSCTVGGFCEDEDGNEFAFLSATPLLDSNHEDWGKDLFQIMKPDFVGEKEQDFIEHYMDDRKIIEIVDRKQLDFKNGKL